MAGFLDALRNAALDVEEEGASAPSGTDIGLDSITSIDLLGFGMCLLLTLFAFKMKSFPFLVVSSIGWMIVGFQVANNSGSIVIFLLTLAISAFQLSYGAKFKGW